jgi:hypothetical protein
VLARSSAVWTPDEARLLRELLAATGPDDAPR